MLVVLLPAPLPHAQLVVGQLLDKLDRDLPQYGLWFALPLAAIGAVALAGGLESSRPEETTNGDPALAARARTATFLWLSLASCEVALAAVAVVWLLGWAVPAHRVVAFTLAIPALAAVGLFAIARWLEARVRGAQTNGGSSRKGRWAAAAIVAAGLVVSGWFAQRTWLGLHPVIRASTLEQARAASDALDRAAVPADRPVVFVLDDRGRYAWSRVWIATHTIRAALSPERIGHTYFYVGTPANFAAGRPTTLPLGQAAPPTQTDRVDPVTYDDLSATYFAALRPVLSNDPVALVLASVNPDFDAWSRRHPDLAVSNGVAAVNAPLTARFQTRLVAGPSAALDALPVAGIALVALAAVVVAGTGWAATLFGRRVGTWEVVALGPAVGTAALVVGAIVLGRFGVKPTPLGAVAICLAMAGTGWAMPAIRARRRHAAPLSPIAD